MSMSTLGRRALLVGIVGLTARLARAQTRIRAGLQIRGEPISGGSLLAFNSGGDGRQATLSPRLLLDFSGPRPMLDVIHNAPPTRISGERPLQSTANPLEFTLTRTPVTGSEAVYRNGMRQERGPDYSISGAVITFSGHYQSDTTPSLLVDYEAI